MGTRGFIGIRVGGETKATYNHYDSYPSYLGVEVAKFAQKMDAEHVKSQFNTLIYVDETKKCPKRMFDHLASQGLADPGVSTGDDWYAALRGAQGDLAAYLRAGYMPDGSAILTSTDSWCEWGYIVDADSRTVEVFRVEYSKLPQKVMTIMIDQLPEGDALREYMTKLEGDIYKAEEELYALNS